MSLAGDRHAGAVVVTEELLDLVPGDLDGGLGEPDAGLRVHVVLHVRVRLDVIVALEVDAQRVRNLALELGRLRLDDECVRRLLHEDGQGVVGRVPGGQRVR